MNQVSLKFYKICNTHSGFQGSFQTIIDDIVAMMDDKKHKFKPAANLSTSDDSDPDTKKQVKLPPFAHHFKQTSHPDSPKYKVDDSNIWNGVTYYLCCFPTHKYKLKWHTHTVETYRTCKRCMGIKNYTSTSPSDYNYSDQENVANKYTIITEPSDLYTNTYDSAYDLTGVPDINYILAAALGQLGYKHISLDVIYDALNLINE